MDLPDEENFYDMDEIAENDENPEKMEHSDMSDKGEIIVFKLYDYGPLYNFNELRGTSELNDMYIGDKRHIRGPFYYGKSPLGSFQFGLLARHPNILPFYDFSMTEQHMILSQPRPDVSLEQILGKHMITDPLHKMIHMINLGQALNYVHKSGFVYCNLSPKAIFFRNGSILLGHHSLMLLRENHMNLYCTDLAYKAPEFLGIAENLSAKKSKDQTNRGIEGMFQEMSISSESFIPSFYALDKNLYQKIVHINQHFKDLVLSEYWSYAVICLNIFFDEKEVSTSKRLQINPIIKKDAIKFNRNHLQSFIHLFTMSPEYYGGTSYLDVLNRCFRPGLYEKIVEYDEFTYDDELLDRYEDLSNLHEVDFDTKLDPDTRDALGLQQPKTKKISGKEVEEIIEVPFSYKKRKIPGDEYYPDDPDESPSKKRKKIRKEKQSSSKDDYKWRDPKLESLDYFGNQKYIEKELQWGELDDYERYKEQELMQTKNFNWDDLKQKEEEEEEKRKKEKTISGRMDLLGLSKIIKDQRQTQETLEKNRLLENMGVSTKTQGTPSDKKPGYDNPCSLCLRSPRKLKKIVETIPVDSFINSSTSIIPTTVNEKGEEFLSPEEEYYVLDNGITIKKKELEDKCMECGVPHIDLEKILKTPVAIEFDNTEMPIQNPNFFYFENTPPIKKESRRKENIINMLRDYGIPNPEEYYEVHKEEIEVNTPDDSTRSSSSSAKWVEDKNIGDINMDNCWRLTGAIVNCFLNINSRQRCDLSSFLENSKMFFSEEDNQKYITSSNIPIPRPVISDGDKMFAGSEELLETVEQITKELYNLYSDRKDMLHPAILFLSIDFYIQRCHLLEYATDLREHFIFCRAIFWLMARLIECGYYIDLVTIQQMSITTNGMYIHPQEIYDLIKKIIALEKGKFLFETIYYYIQTESLFGKVLDVMVNKPRSYISLGTPRNAYSYILRDIPDIANIYIPKYFGNFRKM